MTDITSKDIFLGRKQEDFDLAEKLLIKHGKLNSDCVREMADITQDRLWMAECHEILQRVWNDMHVKKLEDENAKLRELVVRMFRTIEWNDRMNDSMYWPSSSYKQELRELGIEEK